jgi:hypothetical protein
VSDEPRPDPPAETLTRGQQFAPWVLEEMDKPVSPEREAYEARKESEDRECMTHFYRLTRQLKASVPEVVCTLAYKLKGLPPEGPFPDVVVDVEGLCGRKATLALVASDSPHLRAIVLTVSTPSGLSTSSVWLTCGTNREVAEFLKRESLVGEIGAAAEDGVVSLERNRLA